MRDFLYVFLVLVLFVVAILGCIITGTIINYVTGVAQCNEFAASNPVYQFKYAFWNGCLVQLPNGVWLSATKMNWVNGELKIENK